jgi:hypothetical protein
MKKPINKFAVTLWVLAVLVLGSFIYSYFSVMRTLEQFAQPGARLYSLGGDLLSFIHSGLLPAMVLVAFGYLIELVDQIRWNALQQQK